MKNATIENVWKNGTAIITEQELETIPADLLDREGIRVKKDGEQVILSRQNFTGTKEIRHDYEMPEFAGKVKTLLDKAIRGERSCNIMLFGAMGTGKTQFVNEISRQCGFSKVFHVNGIEEMDESAFYGKFVVKVDPKTGTNYTPFEKGPLYRAFIEGTEVDENGNQVLYDENGNVTTDPSGKPKIIGKPAVFFLDEFATVRTEVFLGVFNRAMEIPRNPGESRSIEITAENGKTVKSHPGMVMFFAGNTNGTGNSGKFQYGYTAQSNRMDASTLNRMTGKYLFGYHRIAEKNIIEGKLADDYEADRLLSFRDKVRQAYKEEKVETLFSTRNIIEICETARTYRESGLDDYMTEAIKDCFFAGLPEQDKPAFNEAIRYVYGKDFLQDERNAGDKYDYL